ncbi:MAG: 30S ribosomal protein S13 [Candidatus Woesearchaeota archaeon]
MAEKKRKQLVRIMNTDLKGEKDIYTALTFIKGISFMFSNAVLKAAGISRDRYTGDLSDAEVEQLNNIIKNPVGHIPEMLYNRRCDPETGDDRHLLSTDVKYVQSSDLKFLQKIKSYRGLRAAVGLTTRGQRTKSNFRNKRSKTIGVKRKK